MVFNNYEEPATDCFDVHGFIVHSAAMKVILKTAEKVARTSATVLLTGESGVGKEMVAKAIHRLGNRRNKPLIKINCGAIPANLLESELFGYERGAFTGADPKGKAGYFTIAEQIRGNGTVRLHRYARGGIPNRDWRRFESCIAR
jgi:transcriptional regulator with PAS, ATPase and Fis domain